MSAVSPNHYLGLSGAVTLKTEAFALAQLAISDCVERNAMGAIFGEAGNGKTFAVRSALETVTGRPVIAVDCQYGMTYKGLVELLLEAVTDGIAFAGNRGRLERILLRELRTKPRVICIDEAQRLNAAGIEILRSLHDDPETDFSLLLVGGNGCWDVLCSQPMLRSRIHRPVEFTRLSEARVLKHMPRYHPLLSNCKEDVIRLVDRSYARGNLRNWANFVITAAGICRSAKKRAVDELVVRNAFALLGSRPLPSP